MSHRVVTEEVAAGDQADAGGKSRLWRYGWIAVVILVAIVFARTLGYGLLSDDYVLARPWSMRNVLDAFSGPFDTTNYNDAYFRPLASVVFALEWHVWGTHLWGYHLTNVALHAGASVTVWLVLRRVRVAGWAALVGAAFFALVPANVATAVYVAERTDAMVAILLGAALLCVYRFSITSSTRWIVIVNVLFFVALLTKEVAVALIPFAAVFWLYLHIEAHPPLTAETATGRTGLGAHWRHEIGLAWDALANRAGRRAWLMLLVPLVGTFVVYLAYRTAVMPAGSFGERFGDGYNPLTALYHGTNGTIKGVPWETRPLPYLPILAAFAVGFVLQPRSRAWRVVLLGAGGVLSGVLPLTFNGGVEPRLLYVAEMGLAIAIAGLAMVFRDAIVSARDRRRHYGLVAGVVALLSVGVLASVAVAQVQSQNLYRPGEAKQLSGELSIWKRTDVLPVIPEENVELLRRHLLEAGLIDESGNLTPAGQDFQD